MAAARASEVGGDVLVVEKTDRLGTKLRMTGGGHCNLAHDCTARVFMQHLHGNGRFMQNGLARFFVQELRDYMASIGVETEVHEDGRIFPTSRNAHQVVTALRKQAIAKGAHFRYRSAVSEIVVEDNHVRGVRVGERVIFADSVLLATGGLSYPATGSTGDGYYIAQAVGHSLTPLGAGLVPLVVKENVDQIEGVALSGVAIQALSGKKRIASRLGDLIFTAKGVSGPAVLDISAQVAEALEKGSVRLCIDLAPDLGEDEIDRQLLEQINSMGRAQYQRLLERWMPSGLANWAAARCGVPIECPLNQMSGAQRRRTIEVIKRLELEIQATEPVSKAMITMGGIPCDEIEPQTMASRLVDGLYLTGELLNVSGDSGGYNLQIAFTSGYLAGESASRRSASQPQGEMADD